MAEDKKTGVLLVNLGTPDAPTVRATRRYLKEFLWDPRVVEIPRIPWWLILNGIVLNTRPKKSARAYASVWTDEGSPLLVHSQALTEKLQQALQNECEVELAMRYGNPSIASVLEKMQSKGVERLLVLPLYPQYSSTTTASTFDAIADVLKGWRRLPDWQMLADYHDFDPYIEAMASHIQNHWKQQGRAPYLLFSYHGLPKRNIRLGDPYQVQCERTSELLVAKLGLAENEWGMSFQSRFGKAEWIKPYTETTLKSLPGKGKKEVDVFCPGFPADCLETLEEIAVENRDYFLQAGGERYCYIPALNAEDVHVEALLDLVKKYAC
ncbi:MAG TPA: ferrochelatase [Chromatiales bacterium]|nr:ferrochelatase [Thiotrichales bacterium]HIP69307.1 ferrochelatase [Chromatiales bacterium]